MTSTKPQVGDTITTAEELDALPVGAVILCNGVSLARQVSNAVRWAYVVGVGGYSHTADLLVLSRPNPILVAYIPGRTLRPERVVKAEALREAAVEIASLLPYGAELRHDGSEDPFIAAYADGLRESYTAVTQRADRIERGES